MYSAAGEDYTATSVTVTFQAAVTSQDVMVPILADDLADGVGQFTARLSLPASQDGVMLVTSMATVEITDDDCESFMRPVMLQRKYSKHLCISLSFSLQL